MSENLISNNLVLELHVPSFASVRDFYSKFGFEELAYDPTSGSGSDLGYLTLIRHDPIGNTILNFYGDRDEVANHAHFKDFLATTPRGYGVEITIPVSDIANLWISTSAQLEESSISQPLTMKRWNKQDFRVVDPFGFYVRFTELVDWGQ